MSPTKWEGEYFTRTYHIISNGAAPFTGTIDFTDNLNSALDLNELKVHLPDGTSVLLPNDGTAIQVHALADISTLIPGGLQLQDQVFITEEV